jgi:hypothetical protein
VLQHPSSTGAPTDHPIAVASRFTTLVARVSALAGDVGSETNYLQKYMLSAAVHGPAAAQARGRPDAGRRRARRQMRAAALAPPAAGAAPPADPMRQPPPGGQPDDSLRRRLQTFRVRNLTGTRFADTRDKPRWQTTRRTGYVREVGNRCSRLSTPRLSAPRAETSARSGPTSGSLSPVGAGGSSGVR